LFSATLTGCSRFSVPGVLGLLLQTGCSRFPASGVLGLLLQTGCSRFPVPGVLGLQLRTGCSRFPVPGVLGYPDRVFSVSCAGRSRPGDFSAGGVTPETSLGLQRGQLTVTFLQLRTRHRVPLSKCRSGILDRTRPLSTARLTSRFPLQHGPDHLDLS